MQVPLFKKVFAGHVKHTEPLFEEQVSQFEEHTMHKELEFPYGFTWFPVQGMQTPLLR